MARGSCGQRGQIAAGVCCPAAALGAERPPTIFVIKGGEVNASKVGLMNPREMAAFFEKA